MHRIFAPLRYALPVILVAAFGPSPAAAQAEKFAKPLFVSIHPKAGGQGIRNLDNPSAFFCGENGCVCTIGKDCREIFAAVRIVDCRNGEPGTLSCEAASKQ